MSAPVDVMARIAFPQQLSLFSTSTIAIDIEAKVKEILARRRAANASGQAGEDIDHIRAALARVGGRP